MIEKVLFTEEECEQIMNLEGGKWFESKTVNRQDQELHSINPFRISTQRQVLIPKDSFITERLKQFGVKKIVNIQKFRHQEEFDNNSYDRNLASILKYTKGGKFKRHQDRGSKGTEWRYRTILIQLSNEDEYEGGDLVLKQSDKDNHYKLGRGDIIVFPSWMLHKVTPITKGKRRVVVGWAQGSII